MRDAAQVLCGHTGRNRVPSFVIPLRSILSPQTLHARRPQAIWPLIYSLPQTPSLIGLVCRRNIEISLSTLIPRRIVKP